MYTSFVNELEDHIQDDTNIIYERELCYSFNYNILQELLSRNSSVLYDFKGSEKAE